MLTEDQKAKLYKAIDAADGYATCAYLGFRSSGPRCVIAQLAALEGITCDRMHAWGASTVDKLPGGSVPFNVIPDPLPELTPYGLPLLRALQVIWDNTNYSYTSSDDARTTMRALVAES